jgi:hypothetical protein
MNLWAQLNSKFSDIAEGWFNLIFDDEKSRDIAIERLMICAPCEDNSDTPEVNLFSYCKGCGCVLEAKARSLKETNKCPRNLWPNLEKTEQASK